jgi:rhodanese-related sulfurtransferase
MQRTITPSELQAMLDRGASITLLDGRRTEDRAKEPAAVPGADWRDPTTLDDWSGKLDHAREIVLYCVRGGSVSNSAVDALQAKGYKARFIEGGLKS